MSYEPKIGDLVNHVLMDKGWVGLLLKIHEFGEEESTVIKGLVYLVSQHSFSKWHMGEAEDGAHPSKLGWVDLDFLRVVSEGNIL